MCEPVGTGLFESVFNPNCGLDIDETCDEETWVRCKNASLRLGTFMLALTVIIILVLIYYFSTERVFAISLSIGAVLIVLSYLGYKWNSSLARTEYQRFDREITGLMKRVDGDRKAAIRLYREEKLSRERNEAISSNSQQSAPLQTGLAAGVGAALVSNMFKK
jgi:hypothetical protein